MATEFHPSPRKTFWQRRISDPSRAFVLIIFVSLFLVWFFTIQQALSEMSDAVSVASRSVDQTEARFDEYRTP